MTSRKFTWVLEADIQACFDEIDHAALLERVRRRISDRRVVALVKAFLKAGVMTASGDREQTLTGTPQGGILSPLLANIALSALDEHVTRQWQQAMATWHQRDRRRRDGLGIWRLVRYADDFVVLVSGERRHAEALRQQVAVVLAPLGLRLSEEKTRVVHIDEGFDFLGFHIRRMRKRGTGNTYFVYTVPSKKAIQSVKDKVKAKTSRSALHIAPEDMIASLGRMLRGWANYFRHGVSSKAFGHVDYHAWQRLAKWLRRKHGIRGWREYRRRFCLPGTWKIAYRGVVFRGASTVAVTRYRYRGANIPTPWEPRTAAATS